MAQENESLAGRVSGVNELVAFQAGGIVSRVVMKQKGGNVTMFAFDAGQELSEHTAPFDALVQVMEGEAEVTIGGEPKRVCAGEIVVMPGNVPHSLKALERFKMMLVMVRG